MMELIDFQKLDRLILNPYFAILDIETTGFSPQRGDKIVEIAIITTDLQGNIVDTYETLVNPKREVSATNIHGITAEMVKNAPYIEDIIDDIIYHLNNKTIVGHNIDFDLRFINFELEKHFNKLTTLKGLCTMKLSKVIVPELPVRKLESFCEYYDIENSTAHSAYCDCESTAKLFHIFKTILLDSMDKEEFNNRYLNPVLFNYQTKPYNVSFKRDDSAELIKSKANRISKMISRLHTNPADSLPVQNYLNLLDDILSDRVITETETDALFDFIQDSKISQNQAVEIHNAYIRKLVRVYLLDGILSQSELADLQKVCELLCINNDTLDKIIKYESAKIEKENNNELSFDNSVVAGKSVCFTGQLLSKLDGNLIDRTQAQQFAMERGLVIKSGVSNKLDYLVTADPNSLSGKARKAKDLGVRIIAEPVFWNMIGLAVE